MILIRADANEQIGAGHVMRCLSVADAFRDAGETVLFATADHKADPLIHGREFDTVCLDTDWKLIGEENPGIYIKKVYADLLITDSYFVSEGYFNRVPKGVRTVYFDDLNEKTFGIDVLINYNIFAFGMDYSGYEKQGTKLLLGPEYTPLRKEFRDAETHLIREEVRDVLVSAGGADPQGITEKLIREVCPEWPEIRFHFVIGNLNPRIAEIKEIAGSNATLHIDEQDMAGLMRVCDIAVAAAGSTLYELCAMGVPTITYTLADNQIPGAEQFRKQGIMMNAGDCRNLDGFPGKIGKCLNEMQEPFLRSEISNHMQDLVDGFGANRIVNSLLNLS